VESRALGLEEHFRRRLSLVGDKGNRAAALQLLRISKDNPTLSR